MFTVTETARKLLADFFKGKEQKQVRIALTHSCGGVQIAMRIDEQKDNDVIYEFEGIEYLIDKNFLERIQPVTIDYRANGFKISSALQPGGDSK